MSIIYVVDTETTGTEDDNDIIEVSLLRLSDDVQKTFYIQPVNWSSVQPGALRVNGHNLEDLKRGFRKNEDGTKTVYVKPEQALVDIEQFLMEDFVTTSERVPAGQNVQFDLRFLKNLWARLGHADTFPFGRMYLDTMQIAYFLDYVKSESRQSYHLNGLLKDYGVKRVGKSHTADSDTAATAALLKKLVESAKSK